MKRSDDKLFAALARTAEWRLSQLDAQEIADMAWIMATVMGS